MRDIKFRAWNKFTATMVPFQKVHMNFKDWLSDDNWLFMQYTGLKDKNGKEIYEGDILSDDTNEFMDYVIFKEGSFIINYYDDFLKDQCKYCKIIGNIHENPELL